MAGMHGMHKLYVLYLEHGHLTHVEINIIIVMLLPVHTRRPCDGSFKYFNSINILIFGITILQG